MDCINNLNTLTSQQTQHSQKTQLKSELKMNASMYPVLTSAHAKLLNMTNNPNRGSKTDSPLVRCGSKIKPVIEE